jgi:energy-coupling factor transporter transmembrane protein EcfT
MQGNNLSGARAPFSWIHRLDPRTKLHLLGASFVMVLLPESPLVVALGTLGVLGHVTLARAWRFLVPIRWLLLTLPFFSLGIKFAFISVSLSFILAVVLAEVCLAVKEIYEKNLSLTILKPKGMRDNPLAGGIPQREFKHLRHRWFGGQGAVDHQYPRIS